MAVLTQTYIESDPAICGGKPRIAGTRIRVLDIAALHVHERLNPEEIASKIYPHLTLAQIHAALAYYYEHREEIDASIRETEHAEARFRQQHPDLVAE
jgi:uncharacterized protein (DUF433 family)